MELLIDMETNVLEDKKGRLVIEIEGVGHTFLNVLKSELWNDSHVKVATYSIKHTEIGKPKFILETDGEESPKAALSGAVSRLKKQSEKFKKELSAIR
jgi:DNA-directed RNA polymerase subunit L